jgi:DNA-binding MarR family transcriptional regulator
MTDTPPSARDAAALLLETLPLTMRILGGAMHAGRPNDGPPLNMGQLRMLEMLHRRPWTLGDLAERHHVAASTMSRTVDVLVKREWVDRRIHPEDRRQVLLSLTDTGIAAHQEMRRHAETSITALLEQLPDDERARLYDGLRVLQQLATRIAQHGPACESNSPESSKE